MFYIPKYVKKIILFVFIFIFSFSSNFALDVFAERSVFGYGYTKVITRDDDTETISAVKTDSDGNIYVFGYCGDSLSNLDLDPSAGIDSRVCYEDVFLTKFDADGTYLYTKVIAGDDSMEQKDLAIDLNDDVYITGKFTSDSMDFDPSGGTDMHTGASDIFLTKFDADGSYIYTRTMEGAGNDEPLSVTTDLNGNVYLVGVFESASVDFNPSGVSDVHLRVGSSANGFITKINADGSYGYTHTFGNDYESANSVVTDSDGNVYMTGTFSSTDLDFDFTGGTDEHSTIGSNDIFLTKINADGSYGYTKTFGGVDGESMGFRRSIVVDSEDNVYLLGNFSSLSVDFDPSGGTDTHISDGSGAMFLTKINADGSYEYTKIILGSIDWQNIAIDSGDNIYIAGQLNSSDVDFDFSGGTDEHSNVGNGDIFLTKINADGSYGYTKIIAGSQYESSYTVTTDANNNIYFVGAFYSDDLDFDPTGGTDQASSGGSADGFLTKFSQTTYHHITDIGSSLTAETSVGSDSVDDEGVDDGILKNDEENIRILDGAVPLADVDTTFSADLDWSTVTGDTDVVNYKSFIHNLTTVDGADSSFTLYVPYHTGDTAVTVCPGASVLTDVAYTCTSSVSYADGESGVSIVTIGASQFWSIPNQTGTGGISGAPVVVASSSTSGSRPKADRASNTVITQDPIGPQANSQFKFVYNLKIGTKNSGDADIKKLQKYLEDNGFSVNSITSESSETKTPSPSNFKFLVNFKLEANIPDVKELQKYLNTNGFPVATTGPGSLNNETTYFGLKTKSALMLFQKSKGLVPDGIMGPITRGVLNAE